MRALAADARFDWALVNIVPELIFPALPAIAGRVDGMVLSGILADKAAAVLGTVEDLGFDERARADDGDWVAFRVERPEADHLAIPPIPTSLDVSKASGSLPLAPRTRPSRTRPACFRPARTRPSRFGPSRTRPALSLSKGAPSPSKGTPSPVRPR